MGIEGVKSVPNASRQRSRFFFLVKGLVADMMKMEVKMDVWLCDEIRPLERHYPTNPTVPIQYLLKYTEMSIKDHIDV